jgi:hypothetical protein
MGTGCVLQWDEGAMLSAWSGLERSGAVRRMGIPFIFSPALIQEKVAF